VSLELLDFDVAADDPRALCLRDDREYFAWPARDGDAPVTVLVERYAVRLRFEGHEHSAREALPQRMREYRATLLEHRRPIEAAARRLFRPGMDEVVLRAIDLGSPLITGFADQRDHCGTGR
jgi:hypothetical protein